MINSFGIVSHPRAFLFFCLFTADVTSCSSVIKCVFVFSWLFIVSLLALFFSVVWFKPFLCEIWPIFLFDFHYFWFNFVSYVSVSQSDFLAKVLNMGFPFFFFANSLIFGMNQGVLQLFALTLTILVANAFLLDFRILIFNLFQLCYYVIFLFCSSFYSFHGIILQIFCLFSLYNILWFEPTLDKVRTFTSMIYFDVICLFVTILSITDYLSFTLHVYISWGLCEKKVLFILNWLCAQNSIKSSPLSFIKALLYLIYCVIGN